MTADQLSSTYNVKLDAGAPDIDVMVYRPLQEQFGLTAGATKG
jgi:multiple sugar transport system substrate-binding protein